MLRKLHVLAFRPIVNASNRRAPVANEFRPHVTHRNRHDARKKPSRTFKRPDGVDYTPGKLQTASLYNKKSTNLNFKQRTQLVDDKGFISWLEVHINMLAARHAKQKPEDEGFATFLRNLAPVLNADSTHRMLNDIRVKKPGIHTVWKPTEQSKPLFLFAALKTAFAVNGVAGVDAQLRYSYAGLIAGRNFSKVHLEDQARLLDLRYPAEWYPATRQLQRTIHLHVGPTNSGKTYHALKRLEEARTGLYAGPLRLLAHEVYTRLNALGKPCDLLTGDEQRHDTEVDGPRMISCTVEMVPLNSYMEVAVVDEIQMIGDRDRGWAWTQALLGIQAKELHLCGEARTVPLIRRLVASMGDQLKVHSYERLSPLKTMSTSLRGNLKNLRKGDCVVVFSRVGIHAMKNQIEQKSGKRVAIIYGSLPPEVRSQQAALFNDPDNDYDILVASDAIGMGLNLAIKRIVFESVSKFNGTSMEAMNTSQIKQIAGRAGRYRTAPQPPPLENPNLNNEKPVAEAHLDVSAPSSNTGLVTTLEAVELPFVRKAMETEAEPIMTAGLLPPTSMLADFARYFPPSTRFSYILLRIQELSTLSPDYHLCDYQDQLAVADAIQPVESLSVHDRYQFCSSPAQIGDRGMAQIVVAYARCMEQGTRGELLSIPELDLEVLEEEVRPDRDYIRRLETLHKSLVLYIWLSYRMTGTFLDQEMAFYVKKLTEQKIDAVLGDFSASENVQRRIRARKLKALLRAQNLDEAESEPENQGNEEAIEADEDLSDLLEEEPDEEEVPETDENLSAVLEKELDEKKDHDSEVKTPEIGSVAEDDRERGSSVGANMAR